MKVTQSIVGYYSVPPGMHLSSNGLVLEIFLKLFIAKFVSTVLDDCLCSDRTWQSVMFLQVFRGIFEHIQLSAGGGLVATVSVYQFRPTPGWSLFVYI